MQPSLQNNIPGRIVMCSVSAWLVLIAAALVQTFAGAGKTGASATYSHGVLRVVIPYRAAHEGSGRLRVEVVDPEDRVIGQIERPDEVVKGSSQLKAELKLDKPLALEELVWHRVRYGFRYDDPKVESLEGVESISNILRLPVLRILGQQTYLAGSKAAVRVIVSDSQGEVIPGRRFTQLTVLRLLTSAALMGNDVRKMPAAWELWDKVCADDRVAYLTEPEAIEPEFRRQSRLSSSSPKAWADSYLLAFATVAGLKLVTFERALRSRGSEVLVL